MFFALSKLLDVLLAPLTWVMLLVGWGLLAAARRAPSPRWRRALPLGLALCVAWVFATEPVANALWRGLERDAPVTARVGATYDAVVLLGGVVDARAMHVGGPASLNGSVERLLVTADVLRDGRARYVVVSGTDPRVPAALVEARVLGEALVHLGVEPARIVLEDRSRNTRENAVETARIVRARGFHSLLLVTSAFHMRRALGCFRAVGLAPDALPVDYRAYDPRAYSGSWLPRAEHLDRSTDAIRERMGWWIYRARGFVRP